MAQRYARLYRDGPKGVLFNTPVMIKWILLALYHSAVIVIICIYVVPIGGLPIDMGLAEFGWYSMFFTIYICNIKLVHAVDMFFWWISWGMIFFSVLCFPLMYLVFGHGANMVGTEDAPFPLAAIENNNFWIGILLITSLSSLPELLMNYHNRRYHTSFHDLAQEVEQIPWYRKQSLLAGNDRDLQPIHPKLDELDEKLWMQETKGIGTSEDDHGTGTDFSMDNHTSLAHGATFRNKQSMFGKVPHPM